MPAATSLAFFLEIRRLPGRHTTEFASPGVAAKSVIPYARVVAVLRAEPATNASIKRLHNPLIHFTSRRARDKRQTPLNCLFLLSHLASS